MEKSAPKLKFTTNKWWKYRKNDRNVIHMNEEIVMKPYGLRQNEEKKIMETMRSNGSNPYIVEFLGVFKKESQALGEFSIEDLYLGMEKGVGSLNQIFESKEIKNKKYLTPINTLVIFLQVIDGLLYMKASEIAHLDLKPGNIMIDRSRKRAKLIDFGISKTRATFDKLFCSGTDHYKAHELEENSKYSLQNFEDMYACDIYSLGKTILKILEYRDEAYRNNEILLELSSFVKDKMTLDDPKKRVALEGVQDYIMALLRKAKGDHVPEKLVLLDFDVSIKFGDDNEQEVSFTEIGEPEIKEWILFMRKLAKVERNIKSDENFEDFLVYDDSIKMVIMRRHYKEKSLFDNESQIYKLLSEIRSEIPWVLINYPHFVVDGTFSKTGLTSSRHFNYFEYPFCPLETLIKVKKSFKVEEIDLLLSLLSNCLIFLHIEASISHGSLDKKRCIWLCRSEYSNAFRIKLSSFHNSKIMGSNEEFYNMKNKLKTDDQTFSNIESEQNEEKATVISKKNPSFNTLDARAKDILDMGYYFKEICSKKADLTKEENRTKIEQWEYITNIMISSDSKERLAVIPYLEKYCMGKRADLILDLETKQEILKKIMEEDDDFIKYELKQSQIIPLSKILAYQDVPLSSEYQIIEENIQADDLEYLKENDEDTDLYFSRLLQESENPKYFEYFLPQNKYLRFIINECPAELEHLKLSAYSRLVANYIEQGFILEADHISKILEASLLEEFKIPLNTRLDIHRGLVNYAYRRNNKKLQQKYAKQFKSLVKGLSDIEEVIAWRGNILYHYFEVKVFYKKADSAYKKCMYLASKMISFLKSKFSNINYSEEWVDFKIANLLDKKLWMIGRYFHEKKKDNIKMTHGDIQNGETIISEMKFYFNKVKYFDYQEDYRFHYHWNKEGIFRNVVENEDSLEININIYPKIIEASRNFLGGNSRVGFALRNFSDALINYYYISGKKKKECLMRAREALAEEIKVGSVFNKLSNAEVHVLQGSQERIDRIDMELNIENTDPESASITRAQFWARKLIKK